MEATGFRRKVQLLLRRASIGLLMGIGLAHASSLSPWLDAKNEVTPQVAACPGGLPDGARCLSGIDSQGAHYLIAIPAQWNNILVLHSHGGPFLGPPSIERVAEDLHRWKVVLQAGYAWAGSSYRQGGVAVRAAAEDTERLRLIFNKWVASPKLTILHGQSWGAGVAAIGAEMYSGQSATGRPYDGVLLSNGVLGGGTRSYDFRLDLRVVYQYLCNNHPLPSEPQYPLWMGLPVESKLTEAQLADRARDCLGVGLASQQRTPLQTRNLKTLTHVIRIPERSVQGHLNWATFHFREIQANRTNAKNVFSNLGVRYTGSEDDDALNEGVARYSADPQAVAAFARDTDPTGRIPVPVLSVSAIHDPTAFVELQHTFRETMRSAGMEEQLLQVFTSDAKHSYLSDPVYPALLKSLIRWVETREKPTPEQVSNECQMQEATFGRGCRFVPDFRPQPLETRVPLRIPKALH